MKVISFSLWGSNKIYTIGALKNAELAETLYEGWVCWFYVGKSCPIEIVNDLKSRKNCKVIEMGEEGNWTSMFWRFLPASESEVDVMISRDTDSRLNKREKDAVDAWLVSEKKFHIMRDHPYHCTHILGGMWGAKSGILRNMKELIDDYVKGNFWQVDQNFLKEIIYNIVRNDCLIHDEFFEKKPFPSKRLNKFFVGMGFDQNDEPLHPEHMEMINDFK